MIPDWKGTNMQKINAAEKHKITNYEPQITTDTVIFRECS